MTKIRWHPVAMSSVSTPRKNAGRR